MACNADFVQFIVDQCSDAGEIAVKKMMGDYCIYCDGVLFGLICDNNLYIKVTEPGKVLLKEVILRPPYPHPKPLSSGEELAAEAALHIPCMCYPQVPTYIHGMCHPFLRPAFDTDPNYFCLEEPGFRIMKTTAAMQMAIATDILGVKGSPYISVPIRMAVRGSKTPSTAVFVGPI